MTNEPNNFDEKCLAMYAKEGSWIDWDCTLLNYGLCEGCKHFSKKVLLNNLKSEYIGRIKWLFK